MEDFYQFMDVIDDPVEKVLATIVQVKGSAYKREGASMLFLANGTQVGMLSAGCLETHLALRAQEVFEKQEPMMVQFDLFDEDDLGWGHGAGCNGTIDILLEPVTKKLQADFMAVKGLLEKNKPVTVLKNLDDLGEYVFLSEDQEPFGQWPGPIPVVNFTEKSGIIPGMNLFQQTYQPRPRLIVFGAGPDALPLASLAAETGFSVHVCDWREEFCQQKNFPKADRLLLGFPTEILEQITFTAYDFVVIMTHNFQRDREILQALLKQNVKYLGILGPKERTKRLLNGENVPAWIFAPIGAAIGAKGPVEIAVSIVAEMIAVWRKPVRESVESLWAIPD
jgi:xanthine dehydrogenase accessory factor